MNSLIQKTSNLPASPGVYLFRDKNGAVLYIGKAKNLKKRVGQYFQKNKNHQPDKLIMINQIADFEYIITDTEAEALLLEANLIKEHKPKFNIVLRDDKNFLYIKLNLELDWPRVELVRKPQTNKQFAYSRNLHPYSRNSYVNQYFGPYPSADSARQTYKLISRIFKFCTCKSFLKKPCLKFHLGWCVCPLETKISNAEYRKIFDKAGRFLSGQTAEIIHELKTEMKHASGQNDYEKAARLRDQIRAIESVTAKQKVISLKKENYDVISLARALAAKAEAKAAINLFIIREGKLINKLNFILEHTENSTDAKIIESFVNQYYATTAELPKEIVVPQKLSIINYQLSIINPSRGPKYRLLRLGAQNAREYLNQQFNNLAIKQFNNKTTIIKLQNTLHLQKQPNRIECYDISNIQGENATGSMVVFTNGLPDKSEYRKFKIRTVRGANDTAMMAEVVSRRLKHPDWPKPDLIILDGGKPQLNTVLKINAVKLSIINYQLSIIALAKKEEQIFLPNHNSPVILPSTSPVLQLLQRLRDEAHRFARNYYLKRHEKAQTHSCLDNIPGLGPKTKKKLLREFGSAEKIKKATLADLPTSVIPNFAKCVWLRLDKIASKKMFL